MKERFKSHRFKSSSLTLIAAANTIIEEMAGMGYTLTVRQLYYQFVARGLLENKDTNYKRLASVIDDARQAGLIYWAAIEDRTRYLRRVEGFNGPEDFVRNMVRRYYAEKLWRDQDCYAEVWVEKDALIGVIDRPCDELRIPYLACRGYASSSELYNAGKRFAAQINRGKKCYLFHLGDHDPSGLDMTRVNEESVSLFSRFHGEVEVRRLALNMDQIEEHNPPPNPAKETDSRFAEYRGQYGDESWELDALNPSIIEGLIRDAFESIIDRDKFDANLAEEREHEDALQNIADNWPGVERYMRYRGYSADSYGANITVDEILEDLEDRNG